MADASYVSETTLDVVLRMVPQLRSWCAIILTTTSKGTSRTPGRTVLGVKLLRLVSKQASQVMLQDIRGYSLCLASESSHRPLHSSAALHELKHSPEAWQLVSKGQLLALNVQILVNASSNRGEAA